MDLNHSTETITIITGDTLTIASAGALLFPVGTTAQRPSSPVAGMERFNSTLSCIERYNGAAWNCIITTDSTLDDLFDVILTAPVSNQALVFNGTNWVNAAIVNSVNLTQPTAGLTLTNSGVTQTGAVTSTFALANDLGAIEALNTNAILVRTATDTWAARTLTAPAAGFTITNPAGTAGNPTFVLANDLSALEGLGSTGIAVRTAADTWAQRTLVAGANITLTNADGVAGNPTIALTGTIVNSVTETQPAAGLTITNSGVAQTGAAAFTFALANDLGAIEALNTNAILVRTATDTWAARTLTAPAAGFTITNPAGTAGNPTFVLANDLSAVEGLSTTGFAVRTAADTWTTRTLVAGSGIILTNTDGVAGNPTIAVDSTAVSGTIFDDLILAGVGTSVYTTTANWEYNLSGGAINSSSTGVNTTSQCIGVISIETGTTTTGFAGMHLSAGSMLFGWASWMCEWREEIITLATAAQNYNCYIGFHDASIIAGEPTDGAYFEYDFDTSANWRIVTASNDTRTKTTTSVAVSATAFQKLKVEVNAAGTLVTYSINGTSVGTISTNIPTGAGRFFGMGVKIEKQAGTTNRQILLDFVTLQYTYTTPR